MVLGFTKMIHLGFAGLVGIGSYASLSSMLFLHVGYIPSIFFGGLAAALVGFLLSVPGVRLSELGFALVTLAFGEAIVTMFSNIEALGGYNGIMVPDASLFGFSLGGNFRLFYLAYAFTLLLLIIYIHIMKSGIGRALIALADSEVAAQSMGVNIHRYQMMVSAIGAFYAGIAGALFGPLVTFIDPSSFGISETLLLLMMVIIGGMGTYHGPILGAALLAFMPEFVREFKEYRTLVYGIALVTIIIFLPEGIWGRISILWQTRRSEKG
jgi:branched-chain amino acid transport system permease protein